MKKIYLLLMITLFTFCITGCSKANKEITCTKEDETMLVKFENDKITTIIKETITTYEDEDFVNLAYSGAEMTANIYNNSVTGATAEAIKNDKTITLKITLDTSKMEKTYIESYNYDKNSKDFIKLTQEAGYTCK